MSRCAAEFSPDFSFTTLFFYIYNQWIFFFLPPPLYSELFVVNVSKFRYHLYLLFMRLQLGDE